MDAETRRMMMEVLAALSVLSDQMVVFGTKVSILIDTVDALRSEFNTGVFPEEPIR